MALGIALALSSSRSGVSLQSGVRSAPSSSASGRRASPRSRTSSLQRGEALEMGLLLPGGPTAAENAELLDGLRAVLMSPVTSAVHGSAVCAASALASGDDAAWAAFAASLDGAPLSERAQGYLADPTSCPSAAQI
jgi:hypothetical protein